MKHERKLRVGKKSKSLFCSSLSLYYIYET